MIPQRCRNARCHREGITLEGRKIFEMVSDDYDNWKCTHHRPHTKKALRCAFVPRNDQARPRYVVLRSTELSSTKTSCSASYLPIPLDEVCATQLNVRPRLQLSSLEPPGVYQDINRAIFELFLVETVIICCKSQFHKFWAYLDIDILQVPISFLDTFVRWLFRGWRVQDDSVGVKMR